MIKTIYLIVSSDQRVRAVTRLNSIRDDEVAIKLNLTFPRTWGRVTQTLDVEIPDYAPKAELVSKYEIPHSKRRGIGVNVADKLEKAADLIEVHGHVKGRAGNYQEGFCAIAAIIFAGGDPEQEALAHLFDRKITPGFWGILAFNDAPSTTAADVIDMLRTAAKDWLNTNPALIDSDS